jgi:hypothetical protein
MNNNEVRPDRVIVTDVDMPFMSMVTFMVKWAIASIPALAILAMIGGMATCAVTGLGAMLLHH